MSWMAGRYARSPQTSASALQTLKVGGQSGNAPTPALMPQMLMNVFTGGSLYLV